MSGTHAHGGRAHRHADAGLHVHDAENGDAIPTVPPPRPIATGVLEIDTMLGGWERVTAGYLIEGPAPVLIETGSQTSVPVLLAALEQIGVGPAELAGVAVTHIHLDHAGGVGDVARAFPFGNGLCPREGSAASGRPLAARLIPRHACTARSSTLSTAASTPRRRNASMCSKTGSRSRSARGAISSPWIRPGTQSTTWGCTTR